MSALHFDRGTLVATSLPEEPELRALFVEDQRNGVFRAPAYRYREVVTRLRAAQTPYRDEARKFAALPLTLNGELTPHPHQTRALEAWVEGGKRGIVELPTGAGKTILAMMAMREVARPTLIVVPTIELLLQWQRELGKWFGIPIGALGGGEHDEQPITVTTYDSAAFQTEFHGNRFGFLICDECHHLPAPVYRFIAEGSLAPFRLGLTATLERTDEGERHAIQLLGEVNYRESITTLEGAYLAPYEVRTVLVELSEEERTQYEALRSEYIRFLRGSRIQLGGPSAWGQFIALCHRTDEGRSAYRAYREQRKIALTSPSKIAALWEVLCAHRRDRIIIFTEDNETVYRLSRQFLFPTITHQTKAAERKELLAAFSDGRLPVILTSKVLNEGVDVPAANVGIVLSGSGSVREHVQRLGRILRKQEGKHALLYEIVSDVAAEAGIAERRRQHAAYHRA